MNLSLGSVTFDRPLVWVDREDHAGVDQTRARTVGGGQVVFTAPLAGGRPITLEARRDQGWITQAQLDALRAMAAQVDSSWVLIYGAETHTVEFDATGGPALSFTPLLRPRTEPAPTDFFTGTIRLRTL